MSLKDNAVVQSSINRLKNLGFKVYIQQSDPDILLILIDKESIVKAVTRIIDRNITYPKHFVHYDDQNQVVSIWFWRGEEPLSIRRIKYRL